MKILYRLSEKIARNVESLDKSLAESMPKTNKQILCEIRDMLAKLMDKQP